MSTEIMERPFIFLKCPIGQLSANTSANTILLAGTPVPRGHKGIVSDVNISFDTSGGSVKLIVIGPSGDRQYDVLKGVSSDASGISGLVLESGEAIGLAVQSQGSGTLHTYCSGKIVREL